MGRCITNNSELQIKVMVESISEGITTIKNKLTPYIHRSATKPLFPTPRVTKSKSVTRAQNSQNTNDTTESVGD